MLGYLGSIGLLRVHMLLGDSTLSLRVVENVALYQPESERILSHRVPNSDISCLHRLSIESLHYVAACHVVTY